MIDIAPQKKPFNNYEIRGEITIIFLENRKGEKFETVIDTEDLEKIKALDLHWHVKWEKNTQSYYVKATQMYTDTDGKRKGRPIHLHIEVMKSDFENNKEYVDHRNHDTLDNRKNNLVIKSNTDNLINRKGKNSNNKSGYRNVCWLNKKRVWRVQLQINGRNTKLKDFPEDKVHEAGKYAEEMRNKYYIVK